MCLDACERREFARQLVLLWHPRTGDQDREDGDVGAPECGLDLDSQIVVGIVEATAAPAVTCVGTVAPDDGEEHVTARQGLVDPARKVRAGVDAQVHENLVATEALYEAVVEAAGVPRAVVPAVRDENSAHDVTGCDCDNAGW